MPDTHPIAEEATDSATLRKILAEVRLLDETLRAPYAQIAGTNTVMVSDALTTIRNEDPDAIKVVVTNTGTSTVNLREGGIIAAILQPGKSWVSPLSGTLKIEGQCATEESSTVAVATYK